MAGSASPSNSRNADRRREGREAEKSRVRNFSGKVISRHIPQRERESERERATDPPLLPPFPQTSYPIERSATTTMGSFPSKSNSGKYENAPFARRTTSVTRKRAQSTLHPVISKALHKRATIVNDTSSTGSADTSSLGSSHSNSSSEGGTISLRFSNESSPVEGTNLDSPKAQQNWRRRRTSSY